jgi:hypothetical protein
MIRSCRVPLAVQSISLSFNHLRFLSRNGTRIALESGVDTEINSGKDPAAVNGRGEGIWLSRSAVEQIRRRLHELANVFTGVMISGGLLTQELKLSQMERYAVDICECGERGGSLVREIRSSLLEACGEMEDARSRTK